MLEAGVTGIGGAIRARREDRGISQRTLAAQAEISAAFVSQVENGHRQPSLAALGRMARALGTSTGSLTARAGMAGDALDDTVPAGEVHAARSLIEIESMLQDPDACAELVEAARTMVDSARAEQLGAYTDVIIEFADLLEAFTRRRYRAMTGSAIVVVASAISYVVDPEDAWPDAHPHGYLDDVGVLAFTRSLVATELADFHAWRRAGSQQPA
ncbi:MAG: transcriptional regulator with XRE-family HTH domain [Nitriliruptoraceae bacterium]|jgi:transcriptional regulator with XRE-family HTH domain